jgi:hypothetical protein
MGMAAELLAGVPVTPYVVVEVVALEQAMVLDHPVGLFADVGPQHRRGELAVIVRRIDVADVVQQRRHHHVFVRLVLERPGRGLQRVFVAVDPETESRALHGPQ